MTERQYRATTDFLRKTKGRETFAKAFTRLLPDAIAVLYLVMLAVLFFQKSPLIFRFFLVPLVSLVLVTILRKLVNAPRPYEKFSFTPLLPHENGESFPSRHTASAVVIAMAFWYWNPAAGVYFSFAALLVAFSRVLAGLHFPRDVLTGAGFSLLIGWIGFFLL